MSTPPLTGAAIYRRLLTYIKPYKFMFSLAILGMVLAALTQPMFAALMKPLLDEAFVAQQPDSIQRMPLLILGIFLIRGVAEYFSTYHMSWVGRQVIKTLRREVFEHFLLLPVRFFDHNTAGTLISQVTYNIEQVAESTTNVLTVMVRDTLTIIGLIGLMLWLNPFLSLFIFAVVPLLVLLVRAVSHYFRRYSGRIQDSMGDVTQVTEEVIQGQRVVKVFGGEDYERQRFESVNENNRRLHMKLAKVRAASTPIMQLIAAIGIAAIIYVATMPSMLKDITAGGFVAFLSAMMLVTPALKRLTNLNAPLMRGIAASESIFKLLDESREDTEGTLVIERARGDIDYQGVTFAYGADKSKVLKDISFRIPAGKTYAFVGRSGSGKSTLVNLLPRFYDPLAGTIRVDDNDISQLGLQNLRRQIALVSQDVVLFNDTIAHNIAYGGLHDAGLEEIRQAASAAHILEFIDSLPEGFDTMVGDRGVLLSGGQRQRIAIARALLKNAPILILDEATSALDTESERHIQAALEELMRNRTTLVIAHRLSTVEKADCIVVMQDGQIIETGRHAELLQRDGVYAGLYRLQFRDDEDGGSDA